MTKLLIATTNPGKLAEIKNFLSDLPVELVSLSDVNITVDVDETGDTFEDNAILKARFYCKVSKLPTIADDGGIEIDALGGEPGVHSRRWAGSENIITHDQESDERLIAFTLKKMNDIPPKNRMAQMRTVVAFAATSDNIITAEGIVRGIITQVPSPERYSGFPFRSLFYLPELGKFYNHDQLTAVENDKYNHRKFAIMQLKNPKILTWLTSKTN